MESVGQSMGWLLILGFGFLAGFVFRRSRHRIESKYGGYENCPWFFRWAGVRWALMYGCPAMLILEKNGFRPDTIVLGMGFFMSLGALGGVA